jgi:hypothetical protein
MEQIGGGILVKAVHEGIMNSIVLPGRVESVCHVAMSSRFVVPVLLPGEMIVRVSVRGGMSNSAGLREVKPVWTAEMSSSVIGPILLSGHNIESASLGLRSGIEVGLGIGAQLQVLNLARCCPETFMPYPIFADPAWKAGSEPTRHQLLDCRIWIHGIGGERHKESGKCNAKVVRARMVDTESVSIGEACVQRLGLLVFC